MQSFITDTDGLKLDHQPASLLVGKLYHLKIEIFNKNGSDAIYCTDATFKARLFGDSILPVTVVHVQQNIYTASFTVQKREDFILEIMVLALEGQLGHPEYYIQRTPFLINKIIYRSNHLLKFMDKDKGD